MRRPFLPILAWLVALPAAAQPYAQWGGLDPGPHAVGFRVEYVYDYARTFTPERDYRGEPMPGPIHRPIQITLWYPADVPPGAARMPYGEYVYLWRRELDFDPPTEAERRTAVQEFVRRTSPWLHLSAPPAPGQVEAVLAQETAVVAGAEPAAGPFPLVLYPFATKFHTLVAEYLASHGYVVAGIPIVGASVSSNQRFHDTPQEYDAMAGDLGFVYAHLRSRPYVDPTRLAVAGPFGGAGVLYAMRTMQVDALVAWESGFSDVLPQAPGYDVARLRAPLLSLTSRLNDPGPALVDAFVHAERYLLRFNMLDHRDTYGTVERISGVLPPEKALGYDTMVRYARRFLDAYVRGDAEGLAFARRTPGQNGLPDSLAHHVYHPAGVARVLEAELAALLRAGATGRANEAYRQARTQAPADTVFRQATLDVLSFKLIDEGRLPEALQARALNADAYPSSTSALHALGDGYLWRGDTVRAVAFYRRALATLPSDPQYRDEDRPASQQLLEGKLAAHAHAALPEPDPAWRRITRHPGADFHASSSPDGAPRRSPDGATIAFTSDRDGTPDLYVMPADGAGPARRLTRTGEPEADLAWSPDGRRILFVAGRDATADLFVVGVDGTGLRPLTLNTAREANPSWSPDGTAVTFVSDRDGDLEVYVMDDVAGGTDKGSSLHDER